MPTSTRTVCERKLGADVGIGPYIFYITPRRARYSSTQVTRSTPAST